MDKRVAPDKEGAVDKQCLGEGKLWFQTGADGAGLVYGSLIHSTTQSSFDISCRNDVTRVAMPNPRQPDLEVKNLYLHQAKAI